MRPCDGRVLTGPVVPAAEPAPCFFATELAVREVVPFADIVREGTDSVDGALDLECWRGLAILATVMSPSDELTSLTPFCVDLGTSVSH